MSWPRPSRPRLQTAPVRYGDQMTPRTLSSLAETGTCQLRRLGLGSQIYPELISHRLSPSPWIRKPDLGSGGGAMIGESLLSARRRTPG